MDNKNEVQDFDLDDILNEFHETETESPVEVEADEELEQLLQMPQLTITPVVVKTSDTMAALLQDKTETEPEEDEEALKEQLVKILESDSDEPTVVFAPIAEETETAPEVSSDDTISIPTPAEDPAEESADEQVPEEPAPVEPAFEVPEEFIPSPILFQPRSRLKELKKKLVAGPEKRYYELSEIGVGKLQGAILGNLLVVSLCIAISSLFALDMIPASRLRLVIFSQVLAMLVSGLLGSHLMVDSIADLLKGRFGVNTLLTLTFAACLVDGVFCLKDLRIPCCAAFSLEMLFALMARYQKRTTEMSQLDTMRKAVRLNGIIKVEDYYDGKAGLMRTRADVDDFMDNYNRVSGPELVQSIYAGLSLLACIAIAVFAGVMHGLSLAVQILATSMLVAVPATFFISISRPSAILEKRLHMVGTVFCGWDAVKDLCGKAVYPLWDEDLFPQGSTKLNGVKFYGSREPDEVVAYTTALIIAGGGGLVSVFKQLRKSRNAPTYTAENFQYYGNGGIGGEVCGEPVLLGTLNFLQDMGVEIPQGTMVNQAVYVAIDGQLSAVYAISYAKMRSAAAGLVTLIGYRKLTPVMLCGDFMLTEEFIRSKFDIKTRRIVFPTRDERDLMKKRRPDPQEPVLAITTREELVSTAYAVTGARALRQATKLGVIIHLTGGILGLLIMLVLAYLGSTELLTPTHILLYQLIWAVPGLLITEWTRTV